VIQHDAPAEAGRRVNIHAELRTHAVLDQERQGAPTLLPQPVRYAVCLQRVKALVVQERDVKFTAGRIAVDHGAEIRAHGVEDRRLAVEGLQDHVPQQQGRQCGAVELVGEVEAEGALDGTVIEDRRVQVAREHGLLCGVRRRLVEDLLPHRVEPAPFLRCLGHGYSSGSA